MRIQSFNITGEAHASDFQLKANRRIIISAPDNKKAVAAMPSLPPSTTHQLPTAPSKLDVVRQLLEYMLGHKINLATDQLPTDNSNNEIQPDTTTAPAATEPAFEISESMSIREQSLATKFNGSVQTADGKNINLSVDEFIYKYESTYSVYAGVVKDPLIINTGPGSLNQTGTCDGLPQFSNGSYLAIDKNKDGKIDVTHEILGMVSGDAFKDLAALDSDGNSWVDEADATWKDLFLYTNGSACKASDCNVGALYTNSLQTKFEDTNMYITGKGVGLYENGEPAVLSRIEIKS